MVDATADFYAALNDPRKWIIKQGVPIFKQHRRFDPASKKEIVVDYAKLCRIANNLQQMERDSGIPIRLTLGHTEPGKPETHQPPVAGYYRNARVAPFGPKGEPAIVVDEWLDPTYLKERKNFPYRSSEYYDDTEQVTGVALLTRDPFLDLGVVAYSRSHSHTDGPMLYSRAGEREAAYHVLFEDQHMNPNAAPVTQTNGNDPNAVQPTQTVPQSLHYAVQQPPALDPNTINPLAPPIPYAQQYAGTPSGGPLWPSPYVQGPMAHQHPSTGAVYNNQPGMPPAMGAPGMEGMGGQLPFQNDPFAQPQEPDEDEAGLYSLHHHLGQAVEHLSRYLTAKKPSRYGEDPMNPMGQPQPQMGPPQPQPMPAGPDQFGRYANYQPQAPQHPQGQYGQYAGNPPRPAQPQGQQPYSGHQAHGVPQYTAPGHYSAQGTAPAPVPTGYQSVHTPLNYQLELDKRDAEIRQLKQSVQVIMYEREQADTEACIAQVRQLAAAGYDVGEYEVTELKRRNPQDRAVFLQHVMAKYSRIGTEPLPPILGDPTPAPIMPKQYSRDEDQANMEAALRLTNGNNDPAAFAQALNYIRQNGGATRPGMGSAPPARFHANGMPPEFYGPSAQPGQAQVPDGNDPNGVPYSFLAAAGANGAAPYAMD